MAKRWYVVHTAAGYENKVKADLEHRIASYGLEDVVVDIKVPTEEVTELKEGGKRTTKENKVFPCYVLVRMELDDNSWAIVRNTPGVTGFVGINGKPAPLSREEFDKIMRRTSPTTAGATVAHRTTTDLTEGMAVRVISGPMANFDGIIKEVMPESGKVKVTIQIFGRDTSVELAFNQVATIN